VSRGIIAAESVIDRFAADVADGERHLDEAPPRQCGGGGRHTSRPRQRRGGSLLLAADAVDDALRDAFMDRRFDRAATVVEASVQLATWVHEHSPDTDVPGLMGRVTQLVSDPA